MGFDGVDEHDVKDDKTHQRATSFDSFRSLGRESYEKAKAFAKDLAKDRPKIKSSKQSRGGFDVSPSEDDEINLGTDDNFPGEYDMSKRGNLASSAMKRTHEDMFKPAGQEGNQSGASYTHRLNTVKAFAGWGSEHKYPRKKLKQEVWKDDDGNKCRALSQEELLYVEAIKANNAERRRLGTYREPDMTYSTTIETTTRDLRDIFEEAEELEDSSEPVVDRPKVKKGLRNWIPSAKKPDIPDYKGFEQLESSPEPTIDQPKSKKGLRDWIPNVKKPEMPDFKGFSKNFKVKSPVPSEITGLMTQTLQPKQTNAKPPSRDSNVPSDDAKGTADQSKIESNKHGNAENEAKIM